MSRTVGKKDHVEAIINLSFAIDLERDEQSRVSNKPSSEQGAHTETYLGSV